MASPSGGRRAAQGLGGVSYVSSLIGADANHIAEAEIFQSQSQNERTIFSTGGDVKSPTSEDAALVRSDTDTSGAQHPQDWLSPPIPPQDTLASSSPASGCEVAQAMGITLKPNLLTSQLLRCGQDLARDKRVQAAILENKDLQALIFETGKKVLMNEEGTKVDGPVSAELFTLRIAQNNPFLDKPEQAPSNCIEDEAAPVGIVIDESAAEASWLSDPVLLSDISDSFTTPERSDVQMGGSLLLQCNGETNSSNLENGDTTRVSSTSSEASISWDMLLEDYRCAICTEVMVSPHIVDCKVGHSFCAKCISEWLYVAQSDDALATCPICRQPISAMHPVLTLKKNIEKAVKDAEDCSEKENWYTRYYEDCHASYHGDNIPEHDPNESLEADSNMIMEAVLAIAALLVGVFIYRRVGAMTPAALSRFFSRS